MDIHPIIALVYKRPVAMLENMHLMRCGGKTLVVTRCDNYCMLTVGNHHDNDYNVVDCDNDDYFDYRNSLTLNILNCVDVNCLFVVELNIDFDFDFGCGCDVDVDVDVDVKCDIVLNICFGCH